VGRATTADLLVQRSEERDGARVELRRPLTMANGYGYTLQSDTFNNVRFASLQYQTSYGRYEIDTDPRDTDQTTYSIARGPVGIGHNVLFSRAFQDSYALARVGVHCLCLYPSIQE